MGLIRDALGSALGTNQINNGLSSRPRLPFANNNNGGDARRPLPSVRRRSPSASQGYIDYPNRKEKYRNSQDENNSSSQPVDQNDGLHMTEQYSDRRYRSPMDSYPPDSMQQKRDVYDSQLLEPPLAYGTYTGDGRGSQSHDRQPYTTAVNYGEVREFSRAANFRPVALPQIAYGDGQPFLRGYSQELSHRSIAIEEFIEVIDTINIAIIPSPENQIFQKGASIAGLFLPGAGGLGLALGQIGVGIGAAAGHTSQLSSALSRANMNLFLPNGLEICIGTATDVDTEVGISPGTARPDSINASAAERQAYYGELIAPLSQVLPPLQQSGRNDPIAMLGKGISSRDSQKKLDKAQRRLDRGRSKGKEKLEGGLKWIIVRQASADALMYWENHRQ
ncbi:hypothetical protein V8C37DRAFT_398037 [Trichoderma ceciliae]